MAWSRVTNATLAANVAPPVSPQNMGSLGAALNADDVMVANISGDSNGSFSVSAVSDSLGNTWTKQLSIIPAAGEEHSVWTAPSAAGTPSNITITFTDTATLSVTIVVGAYRGVLASASPIDISKIAKGTANKQPDSGTTVATTTAANELKTGDHGSDGGNKTLNAGTSDTAYSIFVKRDVNNVPKALLEDADSGALGSTARATVSTAAPGPGSNWGMAVMVLKLAPPALLRRYPAPSAVQLQAVNRLASFCQQLLLAVPFNLIFRRI